MAEDEVEGAFPTCVPTSVSNLPRPRFGMTIDLSAMAAASGEFRAVSQRRWSEKRLTPAPPSSPPTGGTRARTLSRPPDLQLTTGSVAAVRRLQSQGHEHSQFRMYSDASNSFEQALQMSREIAFRNGEQNALDSLRSLRRVLARIERAERRAGVHTVTARPDPGAAGRRRPREDGLPHHARRAGRAARALRERCLPLGGGG